MEELKKDFNIVVVDDSQFSRQQISNVLTDHQFNVIGQFEQANEALEFFKGNTVHLAIVDVVLPGASGFELAQQITEHYNKVSIIMVSSLSQERVVLESIASGAHDFIQKPIQETVLIDSVQKIFQSFVEG